MKEIVVFTCTWYPNKEDLRCRMCFDTFKAMAENGISIVAVDGSPSPDVRDYLRSSGATMICEQTSKGKKGAALREAAVLASTMDGVTEDTWLCWQEPEKTDMARHWKSVIADVSISETHDVDVVVPMREDSLFYATYPIEQYHEEKYGNLYLDAVAKHELSSSTLKPIDWFFGPFAFRAKHLKIWSSNTGTMWDAQICPIVHAIRKGLITESVTIPFEAPREMKIQEEGNIDFIEKRLNQSNFINPKVKAAWNEEFYC